ncbi:hypothetical protein [Roseomonas xinghualingensis]|uniref:hypothetical protein n=1 Tax=Roseomonas xinghualingensis TaxID=2986475 RepID=UPI0021F1D578|nr:hypothetical protein [Roseomonas sp. SXEYE001]MCV4209362.1 hypothetical protein [Roseomonas sp. SXEYE001]
MANDRLNWMKFWPKDWRADAALRSCSLAARGLWIEMIGLMHDADPYGHLLVNGRVPDARMLAGMVLSTEKEVKRCLQELEDRGVFDRDGDVIVSRRMVRDNRARIDGQEAGRRGGNPSLRRSNAEGVNPGVAGRGLTPPVNPQDNGEDNPPPYPHPRVCAQAPARACDQALEAEAEEEKESFALLSDRGSDASDPAPPVSPQRKPRTVARPEPEGFPAFYEVYPRHEARKDAADAYRQVVGEAGGSEALLAHLRRYRFSPDRQFIPLAATWLRGRRWQDEQQIKVVAAGPALRVDERYFDRDPREVVALPKPPKGTPEYRAWDAATVGQRTPNPNKPRVAAIA